jgi:hypothetical protein
MPLKITLKVGDDEMTVEADAMDATIVDLAKTWVMALPPADPAGEDAERAKQIRAVKDNIATHDAALKAGITPAS